MPTKNALLYASGLLAIALILLLLGGTENLVANDGDGFVSLIFMGAAIFVGGFLAFRFLHGTHSIGRAVLAAGATSLLVPVLLGLSMGGGGLIIVPVAWLTVSILSLPVTIALALIIYFVCRQST
jgi:hypothetical protein